VSRPSEAGGYTRPRANITRLLHHTTPAGGPAPRTNPRPQRKDCDRTQLKTKDPADVHVQEAKFQPGDVVDWHNHPGFALIAVKSGTMSFYDPDCTRHLIGPGEAFVESGGPTKAVNEGSVEALFYVTYVVPQGSPRIVPTDPPACAQ
jgi:quercetin dioxygenase-like cupin family protein